MRVDSTLMGVEMEKMDWRRGNVSFIFHVNDTNSRLYVLDHDHKLYEEIDKMREFTEDEIEEDLNLRLNTQIYSGKMRKPKAVDGEKRVQFIRQKSLFGLGGDKEEQIGPYMTRVYDVPGIEAIAKYRREHLQAQEKAAGSSPSEMTTDLDSIHTNDSTPHDTNNSTPHDTDSGTPHESLDSAKVLAEIGEAEPHMESMLQDARKNLFQYVPSIPRPKPLPSITETEYFPAKIPLPYMHAGRKMIQSEKSKKFRVSVWMADNFPLTIHQLMPFFEIMTLGNKNFEKLQDFISMELPPGFPVRIEIPLFAFLSAQITFLNFQRWEDGGTPPVPQFVDGKSGEWFEIPADYKLGVVIKNIFKDE